MNPITRRDAVNHHFEHAQPTCSALRTTAGE